VEFSSKHAELRLVMFNEAVSRLPVLDYEGQLRMIFYLSAWISHLFLPDLDSSDIETTLQKLFLITAHFSNIQNCDLVKRLWFSIGKSEENVSIITHSIVVTFLTRVS
jgi:hypothetical protein